MEGASGEDSEEDEMVIGVVPPHMSWSPHARIEMACMNLAKMLTDFPTIPAGHDVRKAIYIPHAHCAFLGCEWNSNGEDAYDSEVSLTHHVSSEHGEAITQCVQEAGTMYKYDGGMMAMYNLAISHIENNKIPEVGRLIDRRCVQAYNEQTRPRAISAPMCLICARVLILDDFDPSSRIWWHNVLEDDKFLGMNADETEETIGLETYIREYASHVDIIEFEDWKVSIPFQARNVEILCCPEDKVCEQMCCGVCESCQFPVCNRCNEALCNQRPHRPVLALTNDMWFGYMDSFIYEKNVTYMEMLCASPITPCMMSMQVSVRYRKDFNKEVYGSQDTRVGARGNFVGFMLDWKSIMASICKQKTNPVALPHTGNALRSLINIIIEKECELKGTSKGEEEEVIKEVTSSAIVRREVVVHLVRILVTNKHPAYVGYNMEEVEKNAMSLPSEAENKVPDEIAPTVRTRRQAASEEEARQREAEEGGKDAVPRSSDRHVGAGAEDGGVFDSVRAHIADSADDVDPNAVCLTALVGKLADGNHERMESLKIEMGQVADQLDPRFFLFCYPFHFPFGLGSPDLKYQPRAERLKSAPRVDFASDWAPTLMCRAERQYRGDLTMPCAAYNLVSKTTINVGKDMTAVNRTAFSDKYSPDDYRDAALNICECLSGTYTDERKRKCRVNGNLQKLIQAHGLSELSKALLQSVSATCKRIPGTHEVRKLMRQEAMGFQVFLGHCFMVTISPNERHNSMLLRLSRARRNDPFVKAGLHKCPGLHEPCEHESEIVGEVLMSKLPCHCEGPCRCKMSVRERLALAAKDPLASVYAFQAIIRSTLRALFGVTVCSDCPRCNCPGAGTSSCNDKFGCVSKPCGGIFGRIGGYYGSIENQTEDSLHVHTMVHVECLHQHHSLREIVDLILGGDTEGIIGKFKEYKEHVSNESYASVVSHEHKQGIENAAPEYEGDERLWTCPMWCKLPCHLNSSNQAEHALSEEDWVGVFDSMADSCKLRVNHHIHPLQMDGTRKPMAYCLPKGRTAKTDSKCKRSFPHTTLEACEIMCKHRATELGLPTEGRRGVIGLAKGPRNDSMLNATHDAMIAVHRFNSDVMFTQRIPKLPSCEEPGCESSNLKSIIKAIDMAQRRSTCYATEYFTKRQPISTTQLKRFEQGHHRLHEQLKREGVPVSKLAIRHTQRILSNILHRSVCRKSVDATNLLVNYDESHITSAESAKSHRVHAMKMRDYLAVADGKQIESYKVRSDTGKLRTMPPTAVFYNERGHHVAVEVMSPYEFELEVCVCPVRTYGPDKHTTSVDGIPVITEDASLNDCDALQWVAFPEGSEFRHKYIMELRRTPSIPSFNMVPTYDDKEAYYKYMVVTFRPWSTKLSECNPQVLYDLRIVSWEQNFKEWASKHVHNRRTARFILNFTRVYCMREHEHEDDEFDESCREFIPQEGDMEGALKSHKYKRTDISKMKFVEKAWGKCDTGKCQRVPPKHKSIADDLKGAMKEARRVQKAARVSQRLDAQGSRYGMGNANLFNDDKFTMLTVNKWVKTITGPGIKLEGGQVLKCRNAEQVEVVNAVAKRVNEEIADWESGHIGRSEPLRLMVLGAPGTGKSFVLTCCKTLFDVIGYKRGSHYMFTGFQAIVAAQHDGDTLHHFFRIWRGNASMNFSMEEGCSMSMFRWWVVDEISHLTADLLVECEQQASRSVQKADTYKLAPNGEIRSCGGFNVIMLGDFHQLPPPGAGTPLSTPPDEIVSRLSPLGARVNRGLSMIWHETNMLIELRHQIRCVDPWWVEFQDEMRHGALSENNHAMVHGEPTTVPGSWLKAQNKPLCMQAECLKLAGKKASVVMKQECKVCKQHRLSRCRVMKGAKDKCLTHKKFAEAPVIVTNNDMKNAICKARACLFAKNKKHNILWVRAVDKPSAQTTHVILRDIEKNEQSDSMHTNQLNWLSLPARKCGNLFGMLPLTVGMPVAAMNHLNRSADMQLLRGARGHVTGWELTSEPQKEPGRCDTWISAKDITVYVKFECSSSFELDPGLGDRVYPIGSASAQWILDGEKGAMRVNRSQLPIGPNFAETCCQSQGSTKDAVMVDVSETGDPRGTYVAITRVRRKEDICFLSAFDVKQFQQGEPLGVTLLMVHLRGNDCTQHVSNYKSQHMERNHLCAECTTMRPASAFKVAGQVVEHCNFCRADVGASKGDVAASNGSKPSNITGASNVEEIGAKRKHEGKTSKLRCSKYGCKRYRISKDVKSCQVHQKKRK